MLIERTVDVQNVLRKQIQYLDTGSYDPTVQKTMFQTSRMQEIMKVPYVTVIDEVAKVPESMWRQVPMIQDETQKDQKPRGDADQFQSLLHKQDGQSADNDPRFAMNSREWQPRR